MNTKVFIQINPKKKYNEMMHMDYKTWKTNFENEFEQHRKQNTKIIYDYQTGYDYYLNSPEWIMYGDFCNFIRKGTENKGPEITAKYETLLNQNIEIFNGFIRDEFKRVHPFTEVDKTLNQIFQFNNMKLTPETFTPEQTQVFNKAVADYKEEHKEFIEIFNNRKNI